MAKRKSKRTSGAGGRASKRTAPAVEYEDYDSDEPPPPVSEAISSWRLDPEESLSDWTIEILVNGQVSATYNVHKQNLAVGPRRSEYFVKLFSGGGRFAESQEKISRIDLEELSSQYFPELLDYLYEGKLLLTTENATALHSMAKYFDIRRLRWDAKRFWQADIKSSATCGVYYEHARLLQEQKILDIAVKACADNIMSIDKSSRLVRVPDSDFWLKILNEHKEKSQDFSCHISMLIAEFTQQNADELTSLEFNQLTNQKQLPYINVEAALPLIDAERQIVAPGEGRLSSLQKRCIAALSQSWSSIDTEARGAAMSLAKKQNPAVLTEILSGTLSAAKANQTKLESKTQKLERDIKGFIRLGGSSFGSRHFISASNVGSDALPEGRSLQQYGSNVRFEPHAGVNYPLFYFQNT